MVLVLNFAEPQIFYVTKHCKYSQFLFSVFCLINNLLMSRNTGKLKLSAFSFAVSNSWSRQSNTLRSVSKVPKTLPWSTHLFHVSNITRRQWWVTYPFRKPHCWLEKVLSKKVDIWVNIFQNFFDNMGRKRTGLKFSFISILLFLCKGVTSANFKEEGKHADLIALFMLVHKKFSNALPSVFFKYL